MQGENNHPNSEIKPPPENISLPKNDRILKPVSENCQIQTWKGFFNLAGGSILYCLSALSIIYGVSQILAPNLAKVRALSDILPCVLTINVYEIALLVVLVLIVLWKNVTDDALSLVVLIALFIVGSGMLLGIVAYKSPSTSAALGLTCTAIGLAKLLIMRKYVSIPFSAISLIGFAIILIWNFIGPSYVASAFAANPSEVELRRMNVFLSWIVLLAGAVIILVEAARTPNRPGNYKNTPFIHRPAMVLVFTLILLAIAAAHQHYLAWSFVIDDYTGDFIPLIAMGTLLTLELMRTMRNKADYTEMVVACVPLAVTGYALLEQSVMARFVTGVEVLWYPPVMLSLIGLAIVLHGLYHRWHKQLYAVIPYAFGVLLTIGYSPDNPRQLNWLLAGSVFVAMMIVLGLVRKNPNICFVAVLIAAFGFLTTELADQLIRRHGLTAAGISAGITGVGTILIYLIFGRRLDRVLAFISGLALSIFLFDLLGNESHMSDLIFAAGVVPLTLVLWLRTRHILSLAVGLVIFLPPLRKIYILTEGLAAWRFVILSFVLLAVGAVFSILKSIILPEKVSPPQKFGRD